MEYIKKVDLLAAAVEVEYLGRPRMMVSAAKIGMMPSIEAVLWNTTTRYARKWQGDTKRRYLN